MNVKSVSIYQGSARKRMPDTTAKRETAFWVAASVSASSLEEAEFDGDAASDVPVEEASPADSVLDVAGGSVAVNEFSLN